MDNKNIFDPDYNLSRIKSILEQYKKNQQPVEDKPIDENSKSVQAYGILKDNFDRIMSLGEKPRDNYVLANEVPSSQKEDQNQGLVNQIQQTIDQHQVEKNNDVQPTKQPSSSGYYDRHSEALRDAQKAASSNTLVNDFLRAGITGGAAIAGVKPDYSGVDSLQKSEKDVLGNTKDTIQSLKAGEEEKQLYELKNPNSSLSQQARDTYKKVFGRELPTNISAYHLSKAGINLSTLLGHEENQKARHEAAQARKDLKELEISNKEVKDKEKQKQQSNKFTQTLRKEATTGTYGKVYQGYLNADRSSNALAAFSKNPNGYKDYGSLMLALKALQGDDSIVREMEIRMGVDSTSFFNKLRNSVQSAANGKKLQPEQRKEMEQAVNEIRNISKRQYVQNIEPLLRQADEMGISRKHILSDEFHDVVESKPSIQLPQDFKPGSVIKTKSGKSYKVNDDGKTAVEL